MAAMNYTSAELFYEFGKDIMKHGSASVIVGSRRFKSFFGISPNICAMCWQIIKDELPTSYREVHLLWALFFLKCYSTESVNHAVAGCDEKTFRTKVWLVIDKLAFMKVVIWEDRKVNAKPGQTCFTSIDGVDFEINEPSPFSPNWFSHKFNAAGLRYEIGLCVWTGHIVWANGGYPCGAWPDLKIAKRYFVHFMDPGEKSLADRGYNDSQYFILPKPQMKSRHQRVMSRHETINKRLKQFRVLDSAFRHDLTKHRLCFYSVLNITQLGLSNNLFERMIYVAVLFYNIFELFMVMYFANEIKLSSDRLSYCLFESNWVDKSESIKKYVIVFGELLTQPQVMVIGKLYPLTLETFTRIIRSAYSMFNILKDMNHN